MKWVRTKRGLQFFHRRRGLKYVLENVPDNVENILFFAGGYKLDCRKDAQLLQHFTPYISQIKELKACLALFSFSIFLFVNFGNRYSKYKNIGCQSLIILIQQTLCSSINVDCHKKETKTRKQHGVFFFFWNFS